LLRLVTVMPEGQSHDRKVLTIQGVRKKLCPFGNHLIALPRRLTIHNSQRHRPRVAEGAGHSPLYQNSKISAALIVPNGALVYLVGVS
jgi:hypothetical protein